VNRDLLYLLRITINNGNKSEKNKGMRNKGKGSGKTAVKEAK